MSLFSRQNYRDKIIAIATFVGGIYFFLFFIIPETYLQSMHIQQHHEDISLGFIAIGLLTFGLGIINLFMIHGGKILYLKKGWFQSLALIGGLVIMVIFACLNWQEDYQVQKNTEQLNMLYEFSNAIIADAAAGRKDVPEAAKRIQILKDELIKTLSLPEPELENNPFHTDEKNLLYANVLNDYKIKKEALFNTVKSFQPALEAMPAIAPALGEALSLKRDLHTKQAENTFSKKCYEFLFDGLFSSLGSAMFSLLGVYIAAAAYRAFRIKTWESSLMMAAALLVMLGQISYGTLLYSDMPAIRGWLLEIPNSAVARAITIGSSVAGLVLAFRMWFSIESDTFSVKKD
jgi:diacylglycerol kinase